MIVHIIASKSNVTEDIASLRRIIAVIKAAGHQVADDWIESAYKERVQRSKELSDWGTIYKKNLETIARSEVVIAETSFNSFGVGYQVAVAMRHKKPILLLRHASADSDAFATAVVDPWVKRESYGDNELEKIVQTFLENNDIKSKDLRFNFFIDRQIYSYLRWAAFKTGKTKAEILRELIQKEISKREGN